MNAYLMAAGLATRLKPLTKKHPKCLLRVGQKEMLRHWLDACLKTKKFNNIYVNVHHCADMVENWIMGYKKLNEDKFESEELKGNIEIIDERTSLLGTAKTMFWHGDPTEDMMIAYTDTFCYDLFMHLDHSVKVWQDNPDNPIVGLFTFKMPEDGSAGAIETDIVGTVMSFEEKSNKGLVAWAGIMFARKEFIDILTNEDHDLARDVLPRLCNKMRVISHISAYDIGRGVEEYESFARKNT